MKIITKQIKYILYGHRIYFSSHYSWFGFAFVSIKSPCNVLFFVMVVLVSVSDDNCWSSWGSVLGGRLVRTGIDSQGVFGGSWLGLPGLQCTITPLATPPPPISPMLHHHQWCGVVLVCWCVGGCHHTTANIRFTFIPHENHKKYISTKISMDVFGLGCIGL